MRMVFLALAAFALTAADAPQPAPTWITGAWSERKGAEWTEEYWTPMRGTIMIGAGVAGQGDRLRHWEQMRIERGADGRLTFWASPNGKPAIAFPASSGSENEIVFTNLANDYPQRVRYHRKGTSLLAEISQADGSRATRWIYQPMGN